MNAMISFFFLFLLSGHAGADTANIGLAVLVNGGDVPEVNSCDFYADLQRAQKVFHSSQQLVFSADGGSKEGPPNAQACDANGKDLMDANGNPVLQRRSNHSYQPATTASISYAFGEALQKKDNRPIVLYFTDHGGKGVLSLWNGEEFKTSNLDQLLDEVPNNRTVLVVHDHCYAASMADEIFGKDGKIRKNTCAFYAAAPDEMASIDESIMGSAAKAAPGSSLGTIVHNMFYDEDMHSTPTSSSSLYLEDYFKKERGSISLIPQDSCVSLLLQNDSLASINALLSPVEQALAAPVLQSLHKDFLKVLPGTGFDQRVTIQQAEAALAKAEDDVAFADGENEKAETMLAHARAAYLVAKLGQNALDRYDNLRLDIPNLEARTQGTGEPSLLAKLRQEKDEFANLSPRVDAVFADVDHKSQDFQDFVQNHAGDDGNDWRPDLFDFQQLVSSVLLRTQEEHHREQRLATTVRKIEALELMVKKNDIGALQTYMNFLKCENTAL